MAGTISNYQARRFDKEAPNVSDRHPRVVRIRSFFGDVVRNAKIVIDAGCGTGDLAPLFSKTQKVYGLDVSKHSLGIAQRLGYKTAVQDLNEPWKAPKADLVILSEVLEHVYDPDLVLSRAHGALKAGGHIIVTSPNIANIQDRLRLLIGLRPRTIDVRADEKSSGHIRGYTFADMKKLLNDNGFEVVRCVGVDAHGVVGSAINAISWMRIFKSLAGGMAILAKRK